MSKQSAPRRVGPGYWKYGKWNISYIAPASLLLNGEWAYSHEEYNLNDPADDRCGKGVDVADCLAQIRSRSDEL